MVDYVNSALCSSPSVSWSAFSLVQSSFDISSQICRFFRNSDRIFSISTGGILSSFTTLTVSVCKGVDVDAMHRRRSCAVRLGLNVYSMCTNLVLILTPTFMNQIELQCIAWKLTGHKRRLGNGPFILTNVTSDLIIYRFRKSRRSEGCLRADKKALLRLSLAQALVCSTMMSVSWCPKFIM